VIGPKNCSMQLAPTPEDLAAATEMLRDGGDPRRTFCRAASRLLRADTATLWEVRDDELHLTASVAAMPEVVPRLTVGPGSAAGHAAADGTRFFARDARVDSDPDVAGHRGLRSILAEPIRTGARTTGVIAVGWKDPVVDLDPLVSGFVSLMAVQASMAIERADLAERLEHQALTDPLTGLVNRRGLARELDREMARAARHGSPLGFALMDLDNFKAYNDRHGHAVGDRLLARAARAWLARIRAHDTLARYGGEEFVILLPDCSAGSSTSLEVVERVRAATPDGQTASVGLALWDGHEPAGRLVERADVALYAAKDRGRDRALAA
jgi:diguanylate cyclase (GGDEF)-like protein